MKPAPQPRFFIICLIFILVLGASGCSRFNCTRFADLVGSETDLIAFAYSLADDLTATAHPPLIAGNPDMPLLVTTFVDNNDLSKTSKFGRILQEHISSRLVQLGYTVKEIKMTGQLQIVPGEGESILSREIARISPSVKSQAILVGTVSLASQTMYVSARFVSPTDQSIISSTDRRLCMDDAILAMFGLRRQTDEDEIAAPRPPMMNSILY